MKGMLRSIENISRAKSVIDLKMLELFESVVSSNFDLLMQERMFKCYSLWDRLLKEPDSVVFELLRFGYVLRAL